MAKTGALDGVESLANKRAGRRFGEIHGGMVGRVSVLGRFRSFFVSCLAFNQEGVARKHAKDKGEGSIACILFLLLLRPLIFSIIIVGKLH